LNKYKKEDGNFLEKNKPPFKKGVERTHNLSTSSPVHTIYLDLDPAAMMSHCSSASTSGYNSDNLLCYERPGPEVELCRRATNDPRLLSDRVMANVLAMDDKHLPVPNYMDNLQTDLKPYMRRMVTVWMSDVCIEQKCEEGTFPLAVNYIDRVLSVRAIKKSQFQLLASACMFIASKFKDTIPLTSNSLVVYTDFSISVEELLEWELLVLQMLKWDVHSMTPYDFLDQLLHRLPLSPVEYTALRSHSSKLIDICATDVIFVTNPPSIIAAASVCSSAEGLIGVSWCKKIRLLHTLNEATSSDGHCIRICQRQIEDMLKKNIDQIDNKSNLSEQNADNTSTPHKPCTPTDVRDILVLVGNP
jgi:hypothetical protein